MNETFDKSLTYRSHIMPLVEQLKEELEKQEIPYFMTFCVANNKDDSVFHQEGASSEVFGRELTKDQIKEHIKVANGFKAVPDGGALSMSIDMGDTTIDFLD